MHDREKHSKPRGEETSPPDRKTKQAFVVIAATVAAIAAVTILA